PRDAVARILKELCRTQPLLAPVRSRNEFQSPEGVAKEVARAACVIPALGRRLRLPSVMTAGEVHWFDCGRTVEPCAPPARPPRNLEDSKPVGLAERYRSPQHQVPRITPRQAQLEINLSRPAACGCAQSDLEPGVLAVRCSSHNTDPPSNVSGGH